MICYGCRLVGCCYHKNIFCRQSDYTLKLCYYIEFVTRLKRLMFEQWALNCDLWETLLLFFIVFDLIVPEIMFLYTPLMLILNRLAEVKYELFDVGMWRCMCLWLLNVVFSLNRVSNHKGAKEVFTAKMIIIIFLSDFFSCP